MSQKELFVANDGCSWEESRSRPNWRWPRRGKRDCSFKAGDPETTCAKNRSELNAASFVSLQVKSLIDENVANCDSDLLAFLDRSNIGNAQTAGMGKSLGFSDSEYQWLLTIFYIPYITFEWLALMWKLIPPHIWAFVTVLTWYAPIPGTV